MKDKLILVADDHPLVLKGLVSEFKEHDYTLVETAVNGLEALQYIQDKHPFVAFLDVDMPYMSGLEVAEKVNKLSTKIVILTQHKEEGFLLKIKSIGAHAYLLKEDDFSEIENALQAILEEKFYLSTSFDASLLQQMENKIRLLRSLSQTEIKILELIAKQKNTIEIADLLFISIRTVEKHRANIIHKLDLKGKQNAIHDFIQQNRLLIEGSL